MTIRELARRADLTESTVYWLEAEERGQPRAETIAALARALSVSADQLLGLDDGDVKLPRTEEVGPREWISIRLLDSAGMDSGEEISMPVLALPDGIDADKVVAATVTDDASAPEIRQGDLVIIARDQPWSDGDMVALIHKGRLLIRRAFHEGQRVLVVNADLSERHTLAAQAILGRVVSSVRFH